MVKQKEYIIFQEIIEALGIDVPLSEIDIDGMVERIDKLREMPDFTCGEQDSSKKSWILSSWIISRRQSWYVTAK